MQLTVHAPVPDEPTVHGPVPDAEADCERVLRTLPAWFGDEPSLVAYAQAARRLPTFVAAQRGGVIGFASLEQHFPHAWELHCIAVDAASRGQGVGRRLLAAVERWLLAQGAQLLQVKTLAAAHPSAAYVETRAFYEALGFVPLEVFPTLWRAGLPVLQFVKPLAVTGAPEVPT